MSPISQYEAYVYATFSICHPTVHLELRLDNYVYFGIFDIYYEPMINGEKRNFDHEEWLNVWICCLNIKEYSFNRYFYQVTAGILNTVYMESAVLGA